MKLTIPYYLHKVGAGFPSPATDYIEDDIDLNSYLITNAPATFYYKGTGKIYDHSGYLRWRSINSRQKPKS